MRYYFDTEFNKLTLISIGIVSQDHQEYYAVSSEYTRDDCSPWVKENVLPFLEPDEYTTDTLVKSTQQIAYDIYNFVGNIRSINKAPEFWAYFADHDWVLMCELFGGMLNMPRGWPQFCMDLQQLRYHKGYRFNKLPEQNEKQHNALHDARWNKQVYDYLAPLPWPS